jgi:DNA-binding NarL/FixJ family response regulator
VRDATTAHAAFSDIDVVVWDLGPQSAALATRQVLPLEDIRTLALVPDEERALDALRSGAQGVLFRSAEPAQLAAAVTSVSRGILALEPTLLASIFAQRSAVSQATELTPRELDVLNLLAEGLSNKLIANRLHISEHTAKFHVNAILNKLAADTRTEAVVQAVRRGLLML